MAITLLWSPTSFYTIQFDPSRKHLRKTSGTLAVSAGRTWTTSLVTKVPEVGYVWRPLRFNMAALATAINFVQIDPPGGSLVTDVNTPAVAPSLFTADID